MLKISVRNWFTLAAILVRMHAHDGEHLFCLNIFVCLSVVSKQTQFVIVHVCGPWPAYGNRQCKAAAKRKGNPTQCLSTNCVFAVFLLGAQCNKVPFAVYCSVLMCSVGAQNFKACCRVTFFSLAEVFQDKQREGLHFKMRPFNLFWYCDMQSCKILIAQSRRLWFSW